MRIARVRPVHPRERGEHVLSHRHASTVTGSSPRARGTLVPVWARRIGQRFIPASAGNTLHAELPGRPGAVHPRERGEHARRSRQQIFQIGSSPRARGTHKSRDTDEKYTRFIPASAGNTVAADGTLSTTTVHPRERGEHPVMIGCPCASFGSSPRARGTPISQHRTAARRRFIPASAGNTQPATCAVPARSVHPRERGEHVSASASKRISGGSSPRARGTRYKSRRSLGEGRFIPASAGNTKSGAPTPARQSVHPRERGEHAGVPGFGECRGGSSPRARGTRPEDI